MATFSLHFLADALLKYPDRLTFSYVWAKGHILILLKKLFSGGFTSTQGFTSHMGQRPHSLSITKKQGFFNKEDLHVHRESPPKVLREKKNTPFCSLLLLRKNLGLREI